MTRDEAKAILGEGATEIQISNLLDKFHESRKAIEDENKSLKDKLNSQSDYTSIKSQLDEINKSKMTEQELIANKNKEADERLSKANKMLNAAQAKTILSGYGLSEEAINQFVTDDEQTTINNANLIKSQLDTYKETITKAVKAEIANIDVKPNPSNIPQGEDIMTKEKFDKLPMSEQKQFKDANIDKYREWYPSN